MKKIITLALAVLLILPSQIFASPVTIEQLQEQIKALQAQIAQMSAELSVTKKDVAVIKEELRITKTLKLGMSDEEVKKLQEFLSTMPNIYPEGMVTGYFGSLTEKAVKKWQEENGIESVGIVGPKTRAKLGELSGKIPSVNSSMEGLRATTTPRGLENREENHPTTTPSGTVPATPAIPASRDNGTTTPATPAIPATPGHFIYTITVTQGTNGIISPETTSVVRGGNQTFTITPDVGYKISNVIVDGAYQGIIPSYTFTSVTTNHSITANYERIFYSITVTQGANGTITPDTISVPYGGSQMFTITPATGYRISNLIVDGANVAATGTYAFTNVMAAHTLSAEFIIILTSAYPLPILVWGSSGSENGQFNLPVSIATDRDGNVYVVESLPNSYGNNRVQKFDSTGHFITKWGNTGTGVGQFLHPQGIAMGSDGNVYIGDTGDYGNSRIQKFDANGNFILSWGTLGTGNGQIIGIHDIAADAVGNIYVMAANHKVMKFSGSGVFIKEWGSYCAAPGGDSPFNCIDPDGDGPLELGDGQFAGARGIAVDTSGNVYVADTSNHRVQKFDSTGTFITKWKVVNAPVQIVGINTDAIGNVYVTTIGDAKDSVQKYTSNGVFLKRWGDSPSVRGNGAGQFSDPLDVAVDTNGNIYVADTNNSRIQKFTP
jgi:peptidoglycan hydrolase-like protein with peptidoglycan-binding domain